MKIKDSPICSYCPLIDNCLHFFYECEQVEQFWSSFFLWWNSLNSQKDTPIIKDPQLILFGIPESSDNIAQSKNKMTHH